MEENLAAFRMYLQNVKKSSENTILSYLRDLRGFCGFMEGLGVCEVSKINRTNIMAYVYELQNQHKASTTIFRNLASIRAFFYFLMGQGVVKENPAVDLELPREERKVPKIMTLEQVEKLYRKITDEKQCVSLKEMRISGKELLELGAKPGPAIGRILNELLEEILEEPSRNESEWLRKRAEEKLEEMAGHPDQPEREAGICKNNRNRNE